MCSKNLAILSYDLFRSDPSIDFYKKKPVSKPRADPTTTQEQPEVNKRKEGGEADVVIFRTCLYVGAAAFMIEFRSKGAPINRRKPPISFFTK